MKHLTIATLIAISSTVAMADQPTIAISGSTQGVVSASASVTGAGTSFSSASMAAGTQASAKGKQTSDSTTVTPSYNYCCSYYGQTNQVANAVQELSGTTSTYNNGQAFNVSTGSGTGSANTSGNSSASSNGANNYFTPYSYYNYYYYNQGPVVTTSAGTSGSSVSGLSAGPNTGSFIGSGTSTAYTVAAVTSSEITNGSTNVATYNFTNSSYTNALTDSSVKSLAVAIDETRSATAQVSAGALTVDKVVLTNADTNANAVSSANAQGSFTGNK